MKFNIILIDFANFLELEYMKMQLRKGICGVMFIYVDWFKINKYLNCFELYRFLYCVEYENYSHYIKYENYSNLFNIIRKPFQIVFRGNFLKLKLTANPLLSFLFISNSFWKSVTSACLTEYLLVIPLYSLFTFVAAMWISLPLSEFRQSQ